MNKMLLFILLTALHAFPAFSMDPRLTQVTDKQTIAEQRLTRFFNKIRLRIAKTPALPTMYADLPDLTPEGLPTPPTIHALINHLYRGYFDITTITITPIKHGANNEKIFFASKKPPQTHTPSCPFLVFKVYKRTDENYANANLFASSDVKKLCENAQYKESNFTQEHQPLLNNLPILISPKQLIIYRDQSNIHHTIEVMDAAQGNKISVFLAGITKIKSGASKNAFLADIKNKIFTTVGKALGSIHRLLMASSDGHPAEWLTHGIHGDYHASNMTWNLYTDQLYVFDNETFTASINNPQPIAWDIISFVINPILCGCILGIINEEDWGDIIEFFISFIQGYVSVFPENTRNDLTDYIKNLLTNRLDKAQRVIDQVTATPEPLDDELIWLEAKRCFTSVTSNQNHAHAGAEEGSWYDFIKKLQNPGTDLANKAESFKSKLKQMSNALTCLSLK